MRTLVIPDIHQRVDTLGRILDSQPYDEVVFLGDWFDSHLDPPAVDSFGDTCRMLRHLVTGHPRRADFVFLVGNHDIQYIHENDRGSRHRVQGDSAYVCTGFSRSKAREFRREFYERGLDDGFFLRRFRAAHTSQGFVFSHAGIAGEHLGEREDISHFVNVTLREAWVNFRSHRHDGTRLLSDIGRCRGGLAERGGVLWLDWKREFSPSERVGKQIFGHTHVPEPECADRGGPSESWNLDAENFFGIVENGEFRPVNAAGL